MKSPRKIAASGAATIVLGLLFAVLGTGMRAGGQSASVSANPAPTAGQIASLVARAVENQHLNDRSLEEFDRIEHVSLRNGGENSQVVSENTTRIVPTGTGVMRFQLSPDGLPISQEIYRHDLQTAIGALDLAIHPNDREKQDYAKFEKRRHDRDELVDTAAKAFRITWAGRETRGSLTLSKLLLDPNPDFKPTTRLAEIFEHVHAALWVDESEGQMVRLEGDITTDVSFGGGIAGKLYRGGHFVLEQSEVARGVWLPVLYTDDVDGRKFLFGFGIHERTEVSQYRRLGPPAQAIEILRNELNNLDAGKPAH